MPDCFICHSSFDAPQAMQLALALESKNLECWIAPRNIQAGSSYPHEIVEGINGTSTFIILLSSQAVDSQHILRELELAVTAKKKIVPIRIGKVKLSNSMTFLLASVQWIEVTEEEIRQYPDAIAERIIDGKGSRVSGIISPPPKKIPAVLASCILLMSVITIVWWWQRSAPIHAAGERPASPIQSTPAPEPLPEEGVKDKNPKRQPPAIIPIKPSPEDNHAEFADGKWLCEGKSAYLIEWDMVITKKETHLEAHGFKAFVNGKKATAGERKTSLFLQGNLEGRQWAGTYQEISRSTVTGDFKISFSEDFKTFEGLIFTPDGKASSPFKGKSR